MTKLYRAEPAVCHVITIAVAFLTLTAQAYALADPLPSRRATPVKQAIVAFACQ